MTDEKMIEGMAVICEDCKKSCDECFDEYEKTIWQNEIKKADRAKHCQAILHAQRLYNAGYRKLPENAIVIPEKITEETNLEDIIKIAKYNESVRKETAREIFTEVLDLEELKVIRDMGWDTVYNSIYNEILELAKQYGVEVEE